MSRLWTQVPDDTVVLSKTEAGQRVAIGAANSLEPLERRLLSVVNGYTPLRYLVDLVQLQESGLPGAIAKLLDAGLIVIAGPGDTPTDR